MMRARLTIFGLAAVTVAGCATNSRPDERPMEADVPSAVTAEVADRSGSRRARASVEEAGQNLRVRVEATGLTAGAYGAHLHAVGRCDAPDFTTAGPHWNPTGQQHGKDNPQGMHKGDLPNLLVGTDGRGSFEYTIPNASIGGRGGSAILDADGAALVIHQQPDDFRTDPSGNSGARIACGVLR